MNDLMICLFKQGMVMIECEAISFTCIDNTAIVEFEQGTEPCITFCNGAPKINVVTKGNIMVIAGVQHVSNYTLQSEYSSQNY